MNPSSLPISTKSNPAPSSSSPMASTLSSASTPSPPSSFSIAPAKSPTVPTASATLPSPPTSPPLSTAPSPLRLPPPQNKLAELSSGPLHRIVFALLCYSAPGSPIFFTIALNLASSLSESSFGSCSSLTISG